LRSTLETSVPPIGCELTWQMPVYVPQGPPRIALQLPHFDQVRMHLNG